jgi:hypothetical protein
MYTKYLHHIHPLAPFSHLLSLPLAPTPQVEIFLSSCSSILYKRKIRKKFVCLW